MTWSVETWGGHPDLSFFLDSWHSQFVAKPGELQTPRNWQRWSNPELDKIIEEIRTIDFDDPRGIELGQEYVKLVTREMPTIPLMSYNVFTVMDDTYWTGYPSAETDPYTDPVPNWANTKYMFVKLQAAQDGAELGARRRVPVRGEAAAPLGRLPPGGSEIACRAIWPTSASGWPSSSWSSSSASTSPSSSPT